MVRTVADPDNIRAEFAIVVRSDLKHQGLGRIMLEKAIRYCRARGLREIVGQVLAANSAILGLAEQLGFERSAFAKDGIVEVVLKLAKA